jgi:cupin 2 domain-containing protein
MLEKHNLFQYLPANLPEEVFETLLQTANFRLERIVSHGQCSADDFWYQQSDREWVMVLQGQARLAMASGELIDLKAGDYLHLDAHIKHRVAWTDPTQQTIWLALHY